MELIGLFLIASGLLVVAGLAKALRPDDTARALLELAPERINPHLSLRSARVVVRVGAMAETAIGLWALVLPRPVSAALVASSYALFTVVVFYARLHGGALSTCGCFGQPDTPATWLHVAVNALFTVAAVTVALRTTSDATIHAVLGIVATGNYPPSACKPVTAAGLEVFAPTGINEVGRTVPFPFSACSTRGSHAPNFLNVTPVQPGA